MTVAGIAGTVPVSGKCPSFSPDPFLLRDSCPWLPGQLWPGRRQAVGICLADGGEMPGFFCRRLCCRACWGTWPWTANGAHSSYRQVLSGPQALQRPRTVPGSGREHPAWAGGEAGGCLTRPGLCCPPGAEGALGDVGQQQRHPPCTPGPAVLCQQSCLNLLGAPGGR